MAVVVLWPGLHKRGDFTFLHNLCVSVVVATAAAAAAVVVLNVNWLGCLDLLS